MSYTTDDPAERERRRWIKPNAYLWVRPDIRRFMRPDADRFFHPSHRGQTPWYEQPEYISPAMRAYSEKPAWARGRDDASMRANAAAAEAERRAFEAELEQLRANNAELQRQILAQREALALSRLTRKAGFDPNQPRVPAGHPDGGQWTDADGGSEIGRGAEGEVSESGGVSNRISRVRLADAGGRIGAGALSDAMPESPLLPVGQGADGSSGQYSVVLEDEPAFNHVSEHIDRSDDELLARLRRNYYRGIIVYEFEDAQGSFTDLRSANDFVNRTLEENRTVVDLVATGHLRVAMIEKRFGYPTGKEAFRPDADSEPYLRKTYAVRIVIRRDERMRRGYRIVTAFPVNKMRTRRSP